VRPAAARCLGVPGAAAGGGAARPPATPRPRARDAGARGRAAGRRAMYGLAMFFSGRWVSDAARHASAPSAGQLARAGALIVAAATAGMVLVAQPATQAPLTRVEKGSAPAIVSAQPYAMLQNRAIELPRVTKGLVQLAEAESLKVAGVTVASPLANLPGLPAVTLPVPIELPVLPPLRPLPTTHELLGA